MVAILGYSREQIFDAVKGMYTAVADTPNAHFHFPVGDSACRLLGYPPQQLEQLPAALTESFAGVGHPFHAEVIRPGDTVLDIGAGAGVDSLIAGRLVGPEGRVVALDLSPAMTRKLYGTVQASGIDNVAVVQGSAESLPLADASVDVITSNGALNLVPDKRHAVAEMFRVLRPGGRLQLADVVIDRPVTVDCHDDPRLWVECVVGATVEEELLAMFRDAGFEDIRIVRRFDYFAHSPSRQTREVAAGFGARSVELAMRRGPQAPSRLWQLTKRLDPRRWATALWRRGFMGLAGLGLALLTCYGTLAGVGLLTVLGFRLALDETVWAGAIVAFTLITVAVIVAGIRRHRAYTPALMAILGGGAVVYAVLIDYRFAVELSGFLVLAAAVGWDLRLHRREQQRVLGLR